MEISILGKRLVFWGAVLFLIGLIQGALIPSFLNPRMALSAHLAAVQSGMALMVFGLIWGLISLSEKWLRYCYYSSVAGIYLIWFAITLAAVLGASKALPIAGEGFSTTAIGELAVDIIVYVGSGFSVFSAILIVFGLYRGFKN